MDASEGHSSKKIKLIVRPVLQIERERERKRGRERERERETETERVRERVPAVTAFFPRCLFLRRI
jgi:hypothetical protein